MEEAPEVKTVEPQVQPLQQVALLVTGVPVVVRVAPLARPRAPPPPSARRVQPLTLAVPRRVYLPVVHPRPVGRDGRVVVVARTPSFVHPGVCIGLPIIYTVHSSTVSKESKHPCTPVEVGSLVLPPSPTTEVPDPTKIVLRSPPRRPPDSREDTGGRPNCLLHRRDRTNGVWVGTGDR